MKRQNEFPGLDESQLQMLNDSFPAGNPENNLIYIKAGTSSGKTNTLNAVFAILEKDDGEKIIELGDRIDN